MAALEHAVVVVVVERVLYISVVEQSLLGRACRSPLWRSTKVAAVQELSWPRWFAVIWKCAVTSALCVRHPLVEDGDA